MIVSLIIDLLFKFSKIAWWDQVTEIPDLTKIIVFSRGTFIGLNVLISEGGQFWPISIFGLILEWKYAQKNDIKNRISDVINKIIPIFSPKFTIFWWNPCVVDSRVTSFHQKKAIKINKIKINNIVWFIVEFNLTDIVETMQNAIMALIIGHGLIFTMWNGWNLFFIIKFHCGIV